jgi:hypothetical protein
MAKTNENPNPPAADKTPEQALRDDWPKKHKQLAPYITLKGQMRGGLSPSDQARAKEILTGYGFIKKR